MRIFCEALRPLSLHSPIGRDYMPPEMPLGSPRCVAAENHRDRWHIQRKRRNAAENAVPEAARSEIGAGQATSKAGFASVSPWSPLRGFDEFHHGTFVSNAPFLRNSSLIIPCPISQEISGCENCSPAYKLRCIYINENKVEHGLPVTGDQAKPLYKNSRAELVPVPFARPLILCVEDDPSYLELRKKVLEGDGYNVIGVNRSDDALQLLREAPVCCIISDHMLQGRTGLELAKEMKGVKPDVPIILYSGNIPLLLDGVDVYINKGETTEAFLKIVRDVIERYCS